MPTPTATKHAARSAVSSNGTGNADTTGTAQDRRLLSALHAFRRGDFTVRLPVRGSGIETEIAQAFNDCLETKCRMLGEIKRVSRSISRDGRLSQRATLEDASGGWQERPATEPQIKAIYAIVRGAQAMDDGTLEEWCRTRYNCSPAELTRRQASEVIDALKLGAAS